MSSSNAHLAQIFEDMAHLLELQGASRFRVNAYARAARTIKGHGDDLVSLAEDPKSLKAIDGIGDSTADKIVEFAETGRIEAYDKLLKDVPSGLLDVLRIPGLGPKTVKLMWDDMQVESLTDLQRVIDDGSILSLPRMGKKTVENIRSAIAFVSSADDRTPIGIARPIADTIVRRLKKLKSTKQVQYAGSLRRGAETIGDIDVLIATSNPEQARETFTTMAEVTQILANGETKASVRAEFDGVAIQADLRLVPEASFGAALMYFTGSKEHNVRLRERALRQDRTLNEYGLFPDDDKESPPQSRGVKPIASQTEAEIYAALDLPEIPPELREDRGELKLAAADIESLVTVAGIRAELHAHTTETDGKLTLDELIEHAIERGCHTLAVTDHSQSSAIVNGLSPKRLRAQIKAVRQANDRYREITVLAGSEVDILPDGSLDYDDGLLDELDVVVASPHASLRQTPAEAMKRMMAVATNPRVNIIGHPTGRRFGTRPGLELDMAEIAAAAAAHDIALEINAHWRRLDLRDTHVRIALEAGALIAIDCDVHSREHSDNLIYGVQTGRRGGLPAARCINTWSPSKLHKWLGVTT